MDNPFAAYLSEATPPTQQPTRPRPQGKRRRKRRREAEPQTIGTNPETWPPPEPEDYLDDDAEPDYLPPTGALPEELPVDNESDGGFTGDWNDWNDWATETATEQRGDDLETSHVPRLTDYGGGGPISRRPRKKFDDGQFDASSRSKVPAALGGVVAALVLVGAVGLAAVEFGSDDSGTAPTVASASMPTESSSSSTMVVPPLPEHGLPGCEDFRSAAITISADRGDTSTPQNAILGFEHSYYVDRDAAKARSYVTDDAHVGDEAALAAGIATLPAGIKYCTHITRADQTDTSVWHVTVQQLWPGDTAIEKLPFTVHTTEVATGRYLITSIDYR